MAAFTGTPTGSTQYTAQKGTPPATMAKASDVDAKVKAAYFSYTHVAAAGAGTGEVNLVVLPQGRKRILSDLSRIVTSQFAVNAEIHLGFRAYTDLDSGLTVAAVANAFLDNAAAGAGALDGVFLLPTNGVLEINSKEEVTIYAMIDTGNIEATDTIEGYIVYAMGN